MTFQLNGIAHELTAGDAQRTLEHRHEKRKTIKATTPNGATRRDVPVDAFTSGFFWAPGPAGVALANGTWDFRDNYVGAGPPDNIATMGIEMNPCISIGQSRVVAKNYQGQPAPPQKVAYIKDAGFGGNPIIGVRDGVSGFAQWADNGIMTTDVLKKPGCGPTSIRGQFIYEHNQGGGNVMNISAGFGFLTISYSGGPMSLQKSSGNPPVFTIP